MSKRLVVVLALCGALALLPASAFGGKLGKRIAQDSNRGKKPVAVAIAGVQNPGKLSFKVKTSPKRRNVQWLYTTDCYKDGERFRYPTENTGDFTSRSPFRKRMKKGVRNPDRCDVQVSAALKYRKRQQRVTVKVFHKR